MKRSLKILLAALGVYLLLVLLLLAAESAAPDASIRTPGDALWYSLITLTTVGYGDLTPVTPLGRLLGLLLAFGSVGILAGLITLGLRVVSDGVIPLLRLRFARSRNWYVFAEASEEALALAASLRKEDAMGMLLFPAGAEGVPRDAVRLDMARERLARMHGKDGLFFFCIGRRPLYNYSHALECAREGYESYCMASFFPTGVLPEKMHLFDLPEALSRRYWQERPLRKEERVLVLIGSCPAAEALLERALLINVFPAPRPIEYHCFSFDGEYPLLHSELLRSLSEGGDDGDRVIFHGGSPFAQPELLQRADRVILCAAEDEENLRMFEKLQRCFALRGAVHLRLSAPAEGLDSFGSLAAVLTGENVMRGELDRRAMLLNRLYNRRADAPHAWHELTPFLRRSNIAAADHLPVKLRILLGDEVPAEPTPDDYRRARARFDALDSGARERLRETEHRRWLRFHRLYNWRCADERDNEERLHPLLRPYAELSAEERAKDDLAWELLGELGEAEKEG